MNACISIISSRSRCLPQCLKSLWDFYNHQHDYPVYVYYFDDIYDSPSLQDAISHECPQKVIFRPIPYATPPFLKEEELFYNRDDLWYVRSGFGINRKGYLHMCHFMSNYFGYENTDFHQYDYTMSIDDESLFLKNLPYDPMSLLKQKKKMMGALRVYDQKVRTPHQGNYDTRVNLWTFIQEYLKKFNVKPRSEFLKNLLKDPNSDHNFHFYPIADSYVVNLKLFQTPEWAQWIKAVNASGGIYKYRWGDNDINSWFYLIHYEDPIYDFRTVDEGYHNQGGLRHLQDIAPSIRNLDL